MENETPYPEAVRSGNGKEIEIVIDEWVEPVDTTDEGIQDQMEDDVGQNDGGEYRDGSLLEEKSDDYADSPEGQPEKGEMSPVAMVKSLLVIDEVIIEEIEVRKHAGNQSDPKKSFDVEPFLYPFGKKIAGGKMSDEHRDWGFTYVSEWRSRSAFSPSVRIISLSRVMLGFMA